MEADLALEVLKQLRHEARQVDETNARVNELNARLDEFNARLDTVRDELGRRIVESELKTTTAITELTHSVRDLINTLREET